MRSWRDRTTSLLTPSSKVSASRSPSPGRLLNTPPPGSGMRTSRGGRGSNPGARSPIAGFGDPAAASATCC